MESPDEYLGRLHFPGAPGVKGHRGALLRWRDGRSVCVCVACCRSAQFSSLSWSTHPRGPPPSSVHIDFVSVSLYCNFISVVSADGGPAEEGAFVYWL